MRSNRALFRALILLASACLFYFLAQFGALFWEYQAMKEKTLARVFRWEVKEMGGKYALFADYRFEAEGRTWQNRAQIKGPLYLNETAAISALQKKASQSWDSFYSKRNPSRSVLERYFPFTPLFKALCCLLVLVYFFYIKSKYVDNKSG